MNIPARWAYLAVFIGVTGHASSEFFAILSGVSGPEVSVWRYMIGAGGLLVWALSRRDSRDLLSPLREDGVTLVWLSLIGVSATYLAFHWALDFASVIQVATITTTIPIFVGLANRVVNKERISTVKLITGALALIGVALLLTDGALETLTGDSQAIYGVLLASFCAAFGSAYAVLVRPIMNRHGALRVTTISLCIGAVGLWLAVGAFWSVWVDPTTLADRPSTAFWSILVLGLWNTTLTQLLWFGGLSAAPDITRASYLFFLKPVIAALLAVFILAQEPSPLEIFAIFVVTGSVLVEIYWPRISRMFARA